MALARLLPKVTLETVMFDVRLLTVIKVLVEQGAHVSARQPLVVLEAMKMETPLASPYDATVRAVHVAEGDRVAAGTLLVELEE